MEFILNLVPLIPLFPLLSFAVIILFTNRNSRLSSNIAVGAIALSTVAGWGVVLATIMGGHHLQVEGWRMQLNWLPTGESFFKMGVGVDGLTAAMLFMVPFVCMMIFIYSIGYMNVGTHHEDPYASRFFAYISLFAAGMLGLVVADNYLLLFISWEVMGLCSYLLIGFWSFRMPDEHHIDYAQVVRARAAGLKAFLTTRVGDVIFMGGLALLYSYTGTLTFHDIFKPEVLEHLNEMHLPVALLAGVPASTVIALLIFGGAVGKSAQFPLHVWLPDAMEGPTPVSALIHAATMVSAGVYLVARSMPLFAAAAHGHGVSDSMVWVAVIGAITALMGAVLGFAPKKVALDEKGGHTWAEDVKGVLAYSTISQLGYMMMALGIGGFMAGVFHLLTHSFFKALLFLGAGSVIHGMHHGHDVAHERHEVSHDEYFNPNDMANMGGLWKKMPLTFWPYVCGTLALVGIFPFAGFWSKDEILAEAWMLWQETGHVSLYFWVWLAGTLGALFTAGYMGRQVAMVFLGEPRHKAAEHAHESPNTMTYPLIILAFFAAVLGFANAPFLGAPLHHFTGLVHEPSGVVHSAAVPFNFVVAGISTLAAVVGFLGGLFLYRGLKAGQPDPVAKALGPIYEPVKNKFWIDEIYQFAFINMTKWLADRTFDFDNRWVIDPIVNAVGLVGRKLSDWSRSFDETAIDRGMVEGTGKAFKLAGRELRLVQTGKVQDYITFVAVTVLVLIGLYLALPF